MQQSEYWLRTRPLSAGHMRAFEAVARNLNFRAAAEEMALTQSAVSRQIQALEEEIRCRAVPAPYPCGGTHQRRQ